MKKLAIIGTAESSVRLAPYNNPEYELWGLNNLRHYVDVQNVNNFSRWFDIHMLADVLADAEAVAWYKTLNIPLYLQDRREEIPSSVKFPLQEVLCMFPRRYFTNTVSYEIALAIMEGYRDISLYGVDMAIGGEYGQQRPSCEYFLGYLEGMGGKLYIPEQSDLLKTPYLYGFEEQQTTEMERKFLNRTRELGRRIASVQQQLEIALVNAGQMELIKQHAFLQGCLDDTAYYLNKRLR